MELIAKRPAVRKSKVQLQAELMVKQEHAKYVAGQKAKLEAEAAKKKAAEEAVKAENARRLQVLKDYKYSVEPLRHYEYYIARSYGESVALVNAENCLRQFQAQERRRNLWKEAMANVKDEPATVQQVQAGYPGYLVAWPNQGQGICNCCGASKIANKPRKDLPTYSNEYTPEQFGNPRIFFRVLGLSNEPIKLEDSVGVQCTEELTLTDEATRTKMVFNWKDY